MSYWQTHQLLAVTNLVICLGIAWGCIENLNTRMAKQHLQARLRYTLLLAGALSSGLQPALFDSWPGTAAVFFGLCVLVGMVRRPSDSPHPMRRADD